MSSLAGRMGRRINMGTAIGRITAHSDESAGTSRLQVALGAGELRSDIPLLQHYGFSSRPLPGADVHTQFLAGDRSRGVALATGDQRTRPRDLKPGEVCLWHSSGSRVILKENGDILLKPASGKVTVEAAETTLKGDVKVSGTLTAKEVEASGIKLTRHRHGNGHNGAPTGGPME